MSFTDSMKRMFIFYAEQMFNDPSDVTITQVVDAVRLSKDLGLDFWNPSDIKSTHFQRERLKEILTTY